MLIEPMLPPAYQAELTEGGNDPVMLGVAEHHRINQPTFHDGPLERSVPASQPRIGTQGIAKAPHGGNLWTGRRHDMHVDPVVGCSISEGTPQHRPAGRKGRRDLA